MKITVGTRVSGEFDSGVVVAMSKEWCIYKSDHGHEVAEGWETIDIEYETPTEPVSSIAEKEI